MVSAQATSTGATTTANPQCASGKFAYGGGYSLSVTGNNRNLIDNGPTNSAGTVISSGQATGWRVSLTGMATGNVLTVYVTCGT